MTGVPRQYHHQLVHFLRKSFVFGNNGSILTVGTVPNGSLILKPMSGVFVSTVFNAGTNNLTDLGLTAAGTIFSGAGLSLTALNFVPLSASVTNYLTVADIDVILTLQLTGTAATTGAGEAIICYIPDIDG